MTKLEQTLGYTYRDRKLAETALSHSSYANERYRDSLLSYERLEFLGDSILGFLTAEYLYTTFPTKPEGELTRIRAELVCESNLAAVARELHLGEALLLGVGEEQTGGRDRTAILADVVEALIAAAYLDGGMDAAKGIVTRHILPRLRDAIHSHDYKTEFQELVQQHKNQTIAYELLSESGPDHCKEFSVRVLLNGREFGVGSGTSKKRAEQMAASRAIEKLKATKTTR